MSKIIKLLNAHMPEDVIHKFIIPHILPSREKAILHKREVINNLRYSGWKHSNKSNDLKTILKAYLKSKVEYFSIRNLLRIIKNDDDYLNKKYKVDFNNIIIEIMCEPTHTTYIDVERNTHTITKTNNVVFVFYFNLVDMEYHKLFKRYTIYDGAEKVIYMKEKIRTGEKAKARMPDAVIKDIWKDNGLYLQNEENIILKPSNYKCLIKMKDLKYAFITKYKKRRTLRKIRTFKKPFNKTFKRYKKIK